MEAGDTPPCRIVSPDGRCAEVRITASDATVGELADAFDVGRAASVVIDGRDVARSTLLATTSGLRWGSAVTASVGAAVGGPRPDPPAVDPPPGVGDVELAVTAGPACTPWRRFPPGRYVVGRAPSVDIRIDSPSIEAYHVVVEVLAPAAAARRGHDPIASGVRPQMQSPGNPPGAPQLDCIWCLTPDAILDGEVDGGGPDVTVRQLSGRTPIEVDRRDGKVSIAVGTSVIEVRSPRAGDAGERRATGAIVSAPTDPWRCLLHRAPALVESTAVGVPTPPHAPGNRRGPGAIGLVGTGIGAIGAAVLAAAIGQVLFVAFALVGAIASLATWSAGWVAAVVQHRRAVDAYRTAVGEFRESVRVGHASAVESHRRRHPGLSDVLTMVDRDLGSLWGRRSAPNDPLRVTCGRGEVAWEGAPAARADTIADDHVALLAGMPRTIDEVAVPLVLHPDSTLALRGDPDDVAALGRSVLIQLGVLYGPADWQLVAVVGDVERWSWLRWLPHTSVLAAAGAATTDGELRDASERRRETTLVLFTDVPELLASRTGAARRLLDGKNTVGLVVAGTGTTVPAVTDRVCEVGPTGAVVLAPQSVRARIAALDAHLADRVVRSFAHVIDPECTDGDERLPSVIGLGDLHLGEPGARVIAQRWSAAGADPAPTVTLGRAADGVVDIDLVRDGPHALVAGTTGAGKSELLRTFVVGLAARHSPDLVNFVLVDFKGGSTFDACARLPHTVGLVTDLDDGLAERALVGLDAEITRRERLLREVSADDLTGYRASPGRSLPRLVVVIDEFAGLAGEHPELLASLVAIAQRGRSLGVHLVLATQRPAGVVTDDIRANTNLRLALRLADRSEAVDVVGDPVPATFPRQLPGRAALRLGEDELVVFQTAGSALPRRREAGRVSVSWPDDPPPEGRGTGRAPASSELEEWVDAIREAFAIGGYATPQRPWLPPLPTALGVDDLTAGDDWARAIGVIDDPAHQERRPLRWDPAAGNMVVVGSLGAGVTSTARLIVADITRSLTPDVCHVFVVDGNGDAGWDDVAGLDHVGAVIRIDEGERLWRLAARLAHEVELRVAARTVVPQVVVVIDGFDAVRAALAATDPADGSGVLDGVLANGPSVGVSVCATTDGTTSASWSVPARERWVLAVDDPSIARAAGVAAPHRRPPPGRLRVAPGGLEAQVLAPGTLPFPDAATHIGGGVSERGLTTANGPAPVEVLPAHVDPRDLAVRSRIDEAEVELVLGQAADDLAPASLVVPHGDHVFVGGTARTGMTTALRGIVAAWRDCHPDGTVVDVTPATVEDLRRVLDGVDGSTALLIVVDDADRIDDDATGTLAALASAHDARRTIVAAARLDAVRVAYGHWVRAVARRRCGIVLTSPGEIDGELLGAVLPRRSVFAARPGLGWVIDRRGQRLVQLADQPPIPRPNTSRPT